MARRIKTDTAIIYKIEQIEQGRIWPEGKNMARYFPNRLSRINLVFFLKAKSLFINYNKNKQLKGTINAMGNETYFEYDANQNQTAQINPLGYATYYYYDILQL